MKKTYFWLILLIFLFQIVFLKNKYSTSVLSEMGLPFFFQKKNFQLCVINMSHGYHKTHNRSVINLYDLLLNCTCVGTLKIKHYTFWYATAQHLQFLIIAFHYYYFESTVFSSFFFRQCSEMCRHFVFAVITCYSCWRWILG